MEFLTLDHPGFYQVAKILIRFLDDKSLANCRLVNSSWNHWISSLTHYHNRVLSRRSGLTLKPNLQLGTLQQLGDRFLKFQRMDGWSRWTPLHFTAATGQFEECLYIIEHLEDKNPKDVWQNTPLHYAAMYGHLLICQLILDHISLKDVNLLIGRYGWTPLDCAKRWKRTNVVDFLDH